ncbi:KdsC family phosphatase [Bacteroidota bacterium]
MSFFKENLAVLLAEGRINQVLLEEFCDSQRINLDEILEGKITADVNMLVFVSSQCGHTYEQLIDQKLQEFKLLQNKKISMLILDVDGVLTDAGMYYTEAGDEFKKFNAKDGIAIRKLTKAGFQVGIISSGFNKNIIQRRADLLGIQQVYLGLDEKMDVLDSWCKKLSVPLSQVAFIGDDINDLNVMSEVGFSACPADAVLEVKQAADIVLTKNGGKACVREFIDKFLP